MMFASPTAPPSRSRRSTRIAPPCLGRFLQPDPLGYDDGMNLYAYVGGDPVNRIDPTGLSSCGQSGQAPCQGPSITVTGTSCYGFYYIGQCWTSFAVDYTSRWRDARSYPTGGGGSGFGFSEGLGGGGDHGTSPDEPICPAVPRSRPVGTRGRIGAALRDPIGAIMARDIADVAGDAAARRFPGLSSRATMRDAYRHFYWTFAMARMLGPDRAQAFANANEVSGSNPPDEQAMDTWNNFVGIAMQRDPRYGHRPTGEVGEIALQNNCLRAIR